MSTPGNLTGQIRRGLRYFFGSIRVQDFSGGLNLRDAPTELAANESPDLMNVTLDERGGVQKRLGNLNLTSSLSGAAINLYYSQQLGVTFIQDGTTIKTTTDFLSFTSLTPALSTNARVGFCDFHTKVMIVHPIDGLRTYAGGAAMSAVVGGSPKGTMIVPWQNKLWVAGDPAAGVRVYASGAGDETDWTVGGAGGALTVDIREKDDAAVTALGGGQGIDISGRPGLLVFKARSLHRINSVATGTYTTLDVLAGASGPAAVTSLLNRTFSLNEVGIWETDGVSGPALVSAKISPLFDPAQINFSKLSGAVAARTGQRAIFSLPFGAAQTTNNFVLELHAVQGWIVCHDFGYGQLTNFQLNDSQLYGSHPTTGKVFKCFSGWADDSAAYTGRYQTRWYEFASENQARLRRMRLSGRGVFSCYVKTDFSLGSGALLNANLTGTSGVWNTATWGTGVWGPGTYESFQDFWELGVGKAFSIKFSESTTGSATGPSLLGSGANPPVGTFAVYGMQFDFVPLGLT